MPTEQYIGLVRINENTRFNTPFLHNGKSWYVTNSVRENRDKFHLHLYGIPADASRIDKFNNRQARRKSKCR